MPYLSSFSNAEEYFGVEYDSNLESANYYVENNVYYCVGHKLPFSENSFDAVVSFQVIEHVKDLHYSLQELQRVAKPLAKILITGPLLWP